MERAIPKGQHRKGGAERSPGVERMEYNFLASTALPRAWLLGGPSNIKKISLEILKRVQDDTREIVDRPE